jgi:superkiller protein 3
MGIAGLVLAGVCAAGHCQDGGSTQVREWFQRGAQQMQAGDLAGSEAAFRKVTELAPGLAPGWLDMGLVELREGKVTDAIAAIRKSLELDPKSPGGHLFLGIAEYQASHNDDAVKNLKLAIRDDPSNEQGYLWLGIVELNMGHPELAVGPLDKANELNPKDENVLDYQVQAHLAVAKQSYKKLYELNPSSWRIHQLSAVIDNDAHDHQHAAKEYKLALQQAPNRPDLWEGLGWQYRALDDNADAVAAFEKQLKLSPGNPIAMYNLASSEVENGQSAKAIPLLRHVVSVYEVPTQANYYLGRAYASENNFAEAALQFQQATKVGGPIAERAWYQLSQAYRHLGKTAEARAAVMKYQKLREASSAASTKNVQDFLKLNRANANAQSGKQQ